MIIFRKSIKHVVSLFQKQFISMMFFHSIIKHMKQIMFTSINHHTCHHSHQVISQPMPPIDTLINASSPIPSSLPLQDRILCQKTENISNQTIIQSFIEYLSFTQHHQHPQQSILPDSCSISEESIEIKKSFPTEVRVQYNNQYLSMTQKKLTEELVQLIVDTIDESFSYQQNLQKQFVHQQHLKVKNKEAFLHKEIIKKGKQLVVRSLTQYLIKGQQEKAQRILKFIVEQNQIPLCEIVIQIDSYIKQRSLGRQFSNSNQLLLKKYNIKVAENLGSNFQNKEGLCLKEGDWSEEKNNGDHQMTREKYSFQYEGQKSQITSIQTQRQSFKGFEDQISQIDFKAPSFQSFYPAMESDGLTDSEDQDEDDQIQKIVQNFNKQIWDYHLKCTADYHKAWSDISPLFYLLCKIGAQMSMSVEVVGSFATSLWTPHSDINIFFIPERDQSFHLKTSLSKIYNNIKNEKENLKYHCLFLNDKAKDHPFFNIKVEVGEEKRRVAISIATSRHIARNYTKFISDTVKTNHFIAPIFFTFHKLLQKFNLHRPTKRGLKNYAIFLMILKSFQVFPSDNLCQAFTNFIYFFAEVYEFQEEVFEENGVIIERQKLSLVDPINPRIKFGGKDTDVARLTYLFRSVNCALKMGVSKNILEYLWSLDQIFIEKQFDDAHSS